MTSLDEVRKFWNEHPLWTGESEHVAGSVAFFEEHRRVYIDDCFAGAFDLRFLPPPRAHGQNMRILDLGCGIGFWTSEFGMRGLRHIVAADLTTAALDNVAKRLATYGLEAELREENAEQLKFQDESFDHVNCQGVIHHTPNTQKAVAEIARVLRPGGTACISVYYRNPILRLWPYLRWIGYPLAKLGGGSRDAGARAYFWKKMLTRSSGFTMAWKTPLARAIPAPSSSQCSKAISRSRKPTCISSQPGHCHSGFRAGYIGGSTVILVS